MANIILTNKSEFGNGTFASDRIEGLAGYDYIVGYSGNDTIFGGAGGDTLDGGTGYDELYGGDGSDYLYGTYSRGLFADGGGGDDVLLAGFGRSVLVGGAGADRLYGGIRRDVLSGGTGADLLSGFSGSDTLTGGANADTFQFTFERGLYPSDGGNDLVTDYVAGLDILEFEFIFRDGLNVTRTLLGIADFDSNGDGVVTAADENVRSKIATAPDGTSAVSLVIAYGRAFDAGPSNAVLFGITEIDLAL